MNKTRYTYAMEYYPPTGRSEIHATTWFTDKRRKCLSKMPVTERVSYGCIYEKRTGQAHRQQQKAGRWLPRAEESGERG